MTIFADDDAPGLLYAEKFREARPALGVEIATPGGGMNDFSEGSCIEIQFHVFLSLLLRCHNFIFTVVAVIAAAVKAEYCNFFLHEA